MNRYIVNESVIHYAVEFLQRYDDKYPNKSHAKALKEFRALSDYLLENLEQPFTLNIIRHILPK